MKSTEPLIMVFTSEGTVEFTRNPKLYEFFDGEGEMERVSEIKKRGRSYFIKWLMGPFEGLEQTYAMGVRYGVQRAAFKAVESTMLFPTYEEAVEYEVRVLNGMRKQGVTFG